MQKIAAPDEWVLYLFGSSAVRPDPGDIDLLLVSLGRPFQVDKVSMVRAQLRDAVEKEVGKTAHILALSEEELGESSFLDRVQAITLLGQRREPPHSTYARPG